MYTAFPEGSSSDLGMPRSASVGTSGSAGWRALLVTASTCSLPLCTRPSTAGAPLNSIDTRPATRSVKAGPLPLNGTCIMSTCASDAISSAHKCGIEPAPAEAKLRLLGRSEEHTSELQSLMRISYAVFCLNKKKTQKQNIIRHI